MDTRILIKIEIALAVIFLGLSLPLGFQAGRRFMRQHYTRAALEQYQGGRSSHQTALAHIATGLAGDPDQLALARLQALIYLEQMAAQALALADRAYVLDRGRITLEGPAREVRSNPAVIDAYLGRRLQHAFDLRLHPGHFLMLENMRDPLIRESHRSAEAVMDDLHISPSDNSVLPTGHCLVRHPNRRKG